MFNKKIKLKVTKEILKYYGFYVGDNILFGNHFDINDKAELVYSYYNDLEFIAIRVYENLPNETEVRVIIINHYIIDDVCNLKDIINKSIDYYNKYEKQSLENME